MWFIVNPSSEFGIMLKYGVITNDVSDYINLLVRIAHIICNHPRLREIEVLKKIFGPKGDEVSQQFGVLYYEELRDLYELLDIVRIVKCRRLRWAVNVSGNRETRIAYRILVEKSLANVHLEHL
jgi:hypothetical protein